MNKQIKAMIPGSFNPVHKGHIDIIKRASKMFSEVYVVISVNIYKEQSNIKNRFEAAKKAVAKLHLNNVKVCLNKGLTVTFAKKHHISIIIRGIRNTKDAIYERDMAKVNHYLDNKIETILMLPRENLKNLSSIAIRYLRDVKKNKVKGKKK